MVSLDHGYCCDDNHTSQALSDVVESIVGAIYISDNFSPVGAEILFDNLLKPFYDRHITLKSLAHHPTKVLFELLQAHGCQQFEITKNKTPTAARCDGEEESSFLGAHLRHPQ